MKLVSFVGEGGSFKKIYDHNSWAPTFPPTNERTKRNGRLKSFQRRRREAKMFPSFRFVVSSNERRRKNLIGCAFTKERVVETIIHVEKGLPRYSSALFRSKLATQTDEGKKGLGKSF